MFNIIRDTKEQKGWQFTVYGGFTAGALKTADYTIQGFEDKICIERKATSGEIANNMRGENKIRLLKEFDRMSKFEESYFICEFSLETLLKFPEDSGIPKQFWFYHKKGRKIKKIKLSGKYILSFLQNNCEQFGIKLIFCESKSEAEDTAYNILRDYYVRKTEK